MPRHGLKKITARKRLTRGLDGLLIDARCVVGKAFALGPGVNACGRLAAQAIGGLAIECKLIAQDHTAPGGAVVSQNAIRNVENDIALVFLACALLHEILELKHEIVGEGAEQAEQTIVRRIKRRDDVTHQRDHRSAPGALILVHRRIAAHDVALQAGRALFSDDGTRLFQGLGEERDQHLAALVQRLDEEIRTCGFQP